MLDQVQEWWQNTTPEIQTAVRFGGVVLGALVLGQFLGAIVYRALRARNFDAVLRVPGSSSADSETDRGFTPTYIAGLLVRLTVWAAAAWWLARKHERVDIANTLGLVIKRTWALTTVLVASLALGSLLARQLIACLGGGAQTGSPALSSRNGSAAPRSKVGGAVGAVVYVLAVLLVLLIAADLFDWPLTRSSALALWEFAQRLLVACAALFIGSLGAGWARDLVTPDGASSPEKRASQYTALGIVAASTVLAIAVLLSSAGVLYGLAALGILGFLVWMVRGYLPDVTAGLQLRAHKVEEVYLDGEPWQVAEIGFVTTQVTRRGEFLQLKNRQVLEARLNGATPEVIQR
jgi:hypothetical protein